MHPLDQRIATSAFYLLPTRAWELGVGSIISIYTIEKKNIRAGLNFPIRILFFIELLGISMILIPVFLFTNVTPFPGYASISPVIGTGIIILLSNIYLCSGILHDLSIEFNRYVNNNINITNTNNTTTKMVHAVDDDDSQKKNKTTRDSKHE